MDSSLIAAWVGLMVALAALVIAAAQAVQQYVATAQSMRKCEKSVWGPMPGHSGRRVWVWSQFRFRIVFQMPNIFIPTEYWQTPGNSRQFPESTIARLPHPFDSQSTSTVDPESTIQNHSEACWVSFARQVSFVCHSAVRVGLMPGDADRLPADIHIVPMQVSTRDVLALGLMMGMTVDSHTSGILDMSGPSGSIRSSDHPFLGKLLHFSSFAMAPRSALRSLYSGDISRSWLRRLQGIATIAERPFSEDKRRYYERLGLKWRTALHGSLEHPPSPKALPGASGTKTKERATMVLNVVDLEDKEHTISIDRCKTWEVSLRKALRYLS